MAEQAATTVCPRCVELERRVAALEAALAAAKKNSSTSSKPPSSDLVKPRSADQRKRSRRKRGAQPGHQRHERTAFPPEEIDRIQVYRGERCPECGGAVEVVGAPARVVQQVELVTRPITITEHRSLTCRCLKCAQEFTAPIPPEVRRAGLVGPQLTTLVGYLKGACHCSFSTIHKYLRDVLGVSISRGQLRKVCGKVATSLDTAYAELLAALPAQDRLNVDETGHKENGQNLWTWCFRAPLFTLFKIDPSRGSQVLVDALGLEFAGVLGCDYFSAYHKYMRLNEHALVQFCLAHLIRDVRFLVEHPHAKHRAYGRRVLAAIREMFAIIHRREEFATEATFRGALEDQGFEVWTQATFRVPDTQEAWNLANRFHHHGREYLRFITTPDVAPTNNLAEQAIRFVVIDRRSTQGTRSAAGRTWCERIWTTQATCAQNGWRVFDFLQRSVQALFADSPPPSLLLDTS